MAEPVTFLDGRVSLYLGDCREILPTLGPVDAVVTDPPYGETSLQWDRRVIDWPLLIYPHIKPTGSMWVFGSMRMFMETTSEYRLFRNSQDIVWEKHNGTGLFNDRFRRVHEFALHFYPASSRWADIFKAPQFTNDARARVVRKKARPAHWIGAAGATTYLSEDGGPRLQRSVIAVRSEHGRAEHPTQKPIDLLKPLIRYACPPDGLLFDPFMGAGSVGVAARQLGLAFIGIEIEPKYFDIACRRIEEATKQPDMFIEPRPPKAVQIDMLSAPSDQPGEPG